MNENENSPEALKPASAQSNAKSPDNSEYIPDINKQNNMDLADGETENLENIENFIQEQAREINESKTIDKGSHNSELAGALQNDTFENDKVLEDLDSNDSSRNPVDLNEVSESGDKEIKDSDKCDDLSGLDDLLSKQNSDESVQNKIIESDSGDIGTSISETIPSNNLKNDDSDFESETKESADDSSKNKEEHNEDKIAHNVKDDVNEEQTDDEIHIDTEEDSRKDAINTDAASSEDVTNEEQSVEKNEDESNVDEESEDVINDETEDVTNEEPEDVTNEEPEDVTNEEQSVEKNEDESNVDEESEDVINDETEDVTNEEPEDVTNEEPEDVTNEEPEDVTNEEPEDVTNEEPEDVTNEESEDVTNEEPEDDTNKEPEDDTNKDPEDDTNKDPEDVTNEELISANKNEDETNVNEEMETDTSYDKKFEKDDEQMEMDEPENMENDDSKDKSTDFSQESIKPNADIEDDKNQPDFENAPDHNPNDSQQDDNSEVSDPFDELLKSGNSKDTSSLQTTQESQDNSANDSNAEKDNDEPMENESTDADIGDTEAVAEGDEAEEDDDECLLPDTEQEVSEKDKVDAASPTIKTTRKKNRPLSVKPRSLLMKDEFQKKNCNAEDVGAGGDVAKSNETSEDIELDNVSDILESEDGSGDTGANDAALENGVIRETYDLTLTVCVHCGNENPVLFRFLTNEAATALCSHKCLRDFRSKHPSDYRLERRKAQVEEIDPINSKCFQCETNKMCKYKEKQYDTFLYYCSERCLKGKIDGDGGRIVTKKKKMEIRDISLREELCRVCGKKKMCRYETVTGNISEYVCDDGCLGTIRPPQTTKTTRAVRKKKPIDKTPHQQVLKTPLLKLKVMGNATDKYLEQGTKVMAKSTAQAASAREERERSFRRCCSQCHRSVDGSERNLSWETMDFCDESCLGKYQTETGANCANCKVAVNQVSLGKYCVRFGYDVRQFCCSRCLEEFKKGLKICCYCQRDITGDCEGFLAPVGDKGQFKDFCSQPCMERFDQMSKNPSPPAVWAQCAVCSHQKLTHLEVEVEGAAGQRLCSEPCFAAFKFVNNVFPDQCRWCKKYFERRAANAFTIYTDTATHCFCSKACFNVYISNSRHIVPCNWCKVKKYNFDMIKKSLTTGQQLTMCSLNCLTLYQVSINAVSSRRVKCDKCNRVTQAQYHLTMSDATVRNFCTYQCVMSFQGQYSKSLNSMEGQPPAAVPTGAPRRTTNHQRALPATNTNAATTTRSPSSMPVISNVESLASKPSRVSLRHQTPTPTPSPKISPASSPGSHATRAKSKASVTITSPAADSPPVVVAPPPPPPPPRAPTPPPPPPKIYAHVLVKPPPPVEVRNIATSAKPLQQHRAVSCRPQTANAECQTGEELEKRVLIPIPVPIYVPVPVGMYSLPFPIPVPIPLPIPTPVFVPTTRNSAEGIMKEIKKIHDKMPTDPFEAELLMMAEMVAGEKKKAESDSETDDDNDDGFSPADGGGLETSHGHNNNAFGEDMLQMALKMATEYDEPAVDLESAMQANTITPVVTGLDEHQHTHHHQQQLLAEQQRAAAAALAMRGTPAATGGRKRGGSPGGAATGGRRGGGKRRRDTPATPAPAMPEPPAPPQEKPDANMCLKYTFGVNAWKQWVMTKNTEMEKSTIRRKPFKSEILQLTADELNYSLCLFVKEVRKPNGSEYAPDTIYYLVLGIQQYLFENGRIDNIFTDPYYEKFTECLDEVARKFSVLYNDSQYIVTRVEEEHLWESKQLGAHSPHVLLSTLMFFNTKHFNLVTVEEHMQLSFSHIMKHWKRNPNSPGAAKMPGSRNVLLRFYPPQSALDANSRKKKVYEQQENEENPLRCPVKLYEFYLSKCPESVKTRNDVFYLLPERSCVPDSPVWYSTQALAKDALAKMLHRVKMVKEINIALLTS